MLLFRWFAVLVGALVAAFLIVPEQWRGIPFVLVPLIALPAVLAGLRRSPPGTRVPWWVLLTSLVFYNVGNAAWLWMTEAHGRATGDGTVAELFLSAADVLVLVTAIVLVVRRGRRDVGGVIDSVITAVAVGGLLWDAVLLPGLTSDGAPISRQAALFVNVVVIIGTLGALLRLSLVTDERLPALRFFTLAIGAALAGNVASALTADPLTGARPDWTNVLFLIAYAAVGCAALHPSAARITLPGPAPRDELTHARLAFLGLMMAAGPLVGGGRAILGLPIDGLLVAVGSAVVMPLVMVRIARLATQRRAAERELLRLATSDGLTGLPNRAAGLAAIDAELARGPDGLAVLFGDLDGFKPVNDRLGHAAGDELLVAVADRLRASVRADDLVIRFGGDEFVIVCRGADAVGVLGDRIAEAVAHPFRAGGEEVRIGLSVGVAHARPGDVTDELVRRADLAMYEAKKSKAIGRLSLATA